MKNITQNIKAIALGLVIVAAASYAFADWSAPLTSPPTCTSGKPGCDAPINISNVAQYKLGDLGVNGITVNTFSTLSGALQLGITGAATGSVLQSTDASGTARWVATSTLGLGGSSGGGNASHLVVAFQTPGTFSWTAPVGVTSVVVETWGAGGGSAAWRYNQGNYAMPGGNGGYAKGSYSVTPNSVYTIKVGTGGNGIVATVPGGNGNNGGPSSFGTSISSTGGQGALAGNSIGGAGFPGDDGVGSGAFNSVNTSFGEISKGGPMLSGLNGNGMPGAVVITY